MPLKYRVLTIVALCACRRCSSCSRATSRQRVRGADGILHDDDDRATSRCRQGLDLKGGTYLALEVDDSKQTIPRDKKAEAIDRALKTVRTRIDGYRRLRGGRAEAGRRSHRRADPGHRRIAERAREAGRRARRSSSSRSRTRRRRSSACCRELDQVSSSAASRRERRDATRDKPRHAANKGLQGLLTPTGNRRSQEGRLVEEGQRRRRRRRIRAAPIRSSCSRAARSRACSSRAQMPGEFYVDDRQRADARVATSPIPAVKARDATGQGLSCRNGFDVRSQDKLVQRVLSSSTPSRSSPATT